MKKIKRKKWRRIKGMVEEESECGKENSVPNGNHSIDEGNI